MTASYRLGGASTLPPDLFGHSAIETVSRSGKFVRLLSALGVHPNNSNTPLQEAALSPLKDGVRLSLPARFVHKLCHLGPQANLQHRTVLLKTRSLRSTRYYLPDSRHRSWRYADSSPTEADRSASYSNILLSKKCSQSLGQLECKPSF